MIKLRRFLVLFAVVSFLVIGISAARAAMDNVFKGEALTYIVATKAGGGYDTYGRLIAKYMGKHLGATIIVKNMPGAGHIIGANYIYKSKPDGKIFGTFNTGLIHAQILEREGVKFDLNKMSWIGKASGDTRVLLMGAKSEYKSFDDILAAKEPVKFGTAGIGSASTNDIKLLIEALDINGKILPGFSGNEAEMSMMRGGEIDGSLGSYSSLRPFVEFGNGNFVIQMGEEVDGIPMALSYAKSDDARSLINLIASQAQLSRLTAAPPGMPADRLELLRDAYRKAVTDPELIAETEKLKIPLQPLIGEEVAVLVMASLAQSPEMLVKIKSVLGDKSGTIKVKTVLTEVGKGGKKITFEANGKKIKSKVSGSRTKVIISSQEADRGDLREGMKCDIEYTPGEKNEPKLVSCSL